MYSDQQQNSVHCIDTPMYLPQYKVGKKWVDLGKANKSIIKCNTRLWTYFRKVGKGDGRIVVQGIVGKLSYSHTPKDKKEKHPWVAS